MFQHVIFNVEILTKMSFPNAFIGNPREIRNRFPL